MPITPALYYLTVVYWYSHLSAKHPPTNVRPLTHKNSTIRHPPISDFVAKIFDGKVVMDADVSRWIEEV